VAPSKAIPVIGAWILVMRRSEASPSSTRFDDWLDRAIRTTTARHCTGKIDRSWRQECAGHRNPGCHARSRLDASSIALSLE